MAYALLAWRPPDDSQTQDIESEFQDLGLIQFFAGLKLVATDGPRWREVKERIERVVQDHPGMEAIIVMPARGSRVGGWLDDAPSGEDLAKAREIMNRQGSTTQPVFFPMPPADNGG